MAKKIESAAATIQNDASYKKAMTTYGNAVRGTADIVQLMTAIVACFATKKYGKADIEAVIAHSFGVPATVLAASRGAPLPRAVLISGPISVEPYLQRFAQVLRLSGSTFAAMRRALRRLLDRAGLETVDLGTVAPRLSLPALIVHDRGDREVPFLSAQSLQRALPGAELLPTEGLGHRKLLVDPEVVERAVRFAVGWEKHEEAAPLPAARELKVVAG